MKTIFLSLGLLMIFAGGCTCEKDATPKNLIMIPKPAAPKSPEATPPASGGATPETIPQTAPTSPAATQPAPDMSGNHIPHDVPVMSDKITVEVR